MAEDRTLAIKSESGRCGRRRIVLTGKGEERAAIKVWRTMRSRSLGWKGGKTSEEPVQGWEKGSCVAPKRLSAAWKEE